LNKVFGAALLDSLTSKGEEWVAMLEHPNAEQCIPEVPNPEYGK
jgi:dynein heavy chain 1